MEIRKSLLGQLARMICGDSPYGEDFIYRSSSYLTQFFLDIDLDYTHDGSTRYWWVLSVLEELNKTPSSLESMPNDEMKRVIEHLANPDHFFDKEIKQEQSVKRLNELLEKIELRIKLQNRTCQPSLIPIKGDFVSTDHVDQPQQVITFAPTVFKVPQSPQEERLVGVMMPFGAEFDLIYNSIKEACQDVELTCYRADKLWSNSTVMQDIFDLIYCSRIVVVDFSRRNPNVMYETGIAHTLGKSVVPITQSLEDIPFDLQPHRALKYLPNTEGLLKLKDSLADRFKVVMEGHAWKKN